MMQPLRGCGCGVRRHHQALPASSDHLHLLLPASVLAVFELLLDHHDEAFKHWQCAAAGFHKRMICVTCLHVNDVSMTCCAGLPPPLRYTASPRCWGC
jgi:hypothetical protein